MTTLETSETSIFPTAMRFGLIGGLIVIVWTLIKNMSGLATNSMAGIIDMAIYGFVIYSAIKGVRELQGNHISFGKAVGAGVIACSIMGLIAGLFGYIYYNFIDPAAADEIIAYSIEMMEGMGMGEDVLEATAESGKDGFTLFRQVLGGLGGGAFLGLIGSLIGGAIMKKDPPALV